jgi:N-methylhydantoinase A/oxoprolinase/acetone carboxylase beta subunit
MRRIGIDVGGTNTDAVLLEDGLVVNAIKTTTTPDVTTGILTALAGLADHPEVAGRTIDGVVIGTTHFVNAVVQRRDLSRVAAVRIGLPASASLPPFCDWPEDLAELVRGEVFMLEGGHEYDGRPIVPFDEIGMRRAAGGSGRAGSGRSRSPRSSRRSTRAARSGRGGSFSRSARMPPSHCRTTSAASASSSARTPPSSTRR